MTLVLTGIIDRGNTEPTVAPDVKEELPPAPEPVPVVTSEPEVTPPEPENLVIASPKHVPLSPKPEVLVSTSPKPESAVKRIDTAIPRSARPRPQTAARPMSARPPSARPAAPRIRDRGEVKVQEDIRFVKFYVFGR